MLWIVLPTHNEATLIAGSLERLLAFLRATAEEWRVIVADNGSNDATAAIARAVAAREPTVEVLELPDAGKGGAVLAAWTRAARESGIRNQESRGPTNDVHIFMDADLATDIRCVPALIAAIRGGADLAVGSRYLTGARTERSWLRHLVSRVNRWLLRARFGLMLSDPPCGFKAVSDRVVREIVPLVRNRQWFFDTELLIRSQRAGMRIVEIPVAWREPRRGGSMGKVLHMIANDLRAMWRLRRERKNMFNT